MRALLIYNPLSKKGKIEQSLEKVKKRLLEKYKKVDMIKTVSSAHAEEVARVNAGKYDLLIACGGDGTVHNIANGVAKSGEKVVLGILPLGTCNDVARTLHIPRNIDKAIDVILRGDSIPYDMMYDGENYIVYTLAGGLFVASSFETKKNSKSIFGRMAYLVHGFWAIFRIKSLPLTIESAEYTHHGNFIMAIVLNAYSTAGFYINGDSSVQDGMMELVLIEKKTKSVLGYLSGLFTVLTLFIFGLKATKNFRNVKIVKTNEIYIENHLDVPFSADGEKCTFLKKSLEIKNQIEIMQGREI